MKVPLCAFSEDGLITIFRNATREVISPPQNPYVLLETPAHLESSDMVEKYKTFDGKPVSLYRFEFQKEFDAGVFRHKHEGERLFYMNHLEQIYMDHPDFMLGYPNTEELTYLYFDIEVRSDGSGLFPTAARSYVVSIGLKATGPRGTDGVEIIEDFDNHKTNKDRSILKRFAKRVKEIDPDVIGTYHGKGFDIPFIFDRAERENIDISGLQRYHNRDDIFYGRINYDAFLDVKIDGKLLDLKNRKLETVSQFYDYEPILPAPIDATNTIGYVDDPKRRKVFNEYLTDDVMATECVCNVYIPPKIAMAEFLQVPLNTIANASNSTASRIFYSRELKNKGYITIDTNEDRYYYLEGKYEGAIVRINGRCPKCNDYLTFGSCDKHGDIPEDNRIKPGFIPAVHKVDFASYYATTMITFNLSPETTRILNVVEDGATELTVEIKPTTYIMKVPDKNFGKTIIIEVDRNYDGITKKALSQFQIERKAIKSKMKKLGKEHKDYKKLDTQQDVYKLLGNIMYGYHGLRFSSWGDYAVAIAIVGLCRWMTNMAMIEVGSAMTETDSVIGDTPIYVRDKITDEIDIIPIKDLHSDITKKRTQYQGRLEVLSRGGWTPIIYTKAHSVSKAIHRVKTSNGYVVITEDHSLFEADTHKEISPKNIKAGSRIEVMDTSEYHFHKTPFDNKVIDNMVLAPNQKHNTVVYDISTDDGTFITASGDIVLHNTDGLWLNRWQDDWDIKLTNIINDRIKAEFGIEDSWIVMEYEEPKGIPGFFYRMKSYALLDGEKLIRHGVALKSSRHPKVYDRAVEMVARSILTQENITPGELANKATDFTDLPMEYFILRLRFNKSPEDYDGVASLPIRLAKQAKDSMGVKVKPGDQVEYVVCQGKDYRLASLIDDKWDLDMEFYKEEVSKVLDIFDIPNTPGQMSLF